MLGDIGSGVIVGGLLGIIGNYIGGIMGAEKNYKLLQKSKSIEIDKERRINKSLLAVCIDAANSFLQQASRDLSCECKQTENIKCYIHRAIIDDAWKIYLHKSGLDFDDISTIMIWFSDVENLIQNIISDAYENTDLNGQVNGLLKNDKVKNIRDKIR